MTSDSNIAREGNLHVLCPKRVFTFVYTLSKRTDLDSKPHRQHTVSHDRVRSLGRSSDPVLRTLVIEYPMT